jgi:plasmid stabilization system protein ParE
VRVVLRARAENDLRAAFRWYESMRAGLGEQFLTAVRERLANISEYPEAHPMVYRHVRRAVVSRFPYLVFYTAHRSRIDVLAVMHHARNPTRWPSG